MDLKRSFVAVDSAFLRQKTLGCFDPDTGSSQQEIEVAALVPIVDNCTKLEYCSCLLVLSVGAKAVAAGIETACIAAVIEHIADFAGFELRMDCFAAGLSGAVGIVEGFELVDSGHSKTAVVVTGHSRFVAGISVPAAAERMDWWETCCLLD